jgi:hypothetical protein
LLTSASAPATGLPLIVVAVVAELGLGYGVDQPRDPEWYKRAVFYEVLVRGFQDSDGTAPATCAG